MEEEQRAERIARRIEEYHIVLTDIYEKLVDREFKPVQNKSPEKKINMELLKRTSPDMYERIKSSKDRDPNKEIQDRIKERKKEIEKRMNR